MSLHRLIIDQDHAIKMETAGLDQPGGARVPQRHFSLRKLLGDPSPSLLFSSLELGDTKVYEP